MKRGIYILKVELMVFDDHLGVGCEREELQKKKKTAQDLSQTAKRTELTLPEFGKTV